MQVSRHHLDQLDILFAKKKNIFSPFLIFHMERPQWQCCFTGYLCLSSFKMYGQRVDEWHKCRLQNCSKLKATVTMTAIWTGLVQWEQAHLVPSVENPNQISTQIQYGWQNNLHDDCGHWNSKGGMKNEYI